MNEKVKFSFSFFPIFRVLLVAIHVIIRSMCPFSVWTLNATGRSTYYDENSVGNFNRLFRSVSILALAKLRKIGYSSNRQSPSWYYC